MNKFAIVILSIATLIAGSCKREQISLTALPTPVTHQVLVITETQGYRHESIEAGLEMFTSHAEEWKIAVTHAENTGAILTNNVYDYSVIVLLNSTGDIFEENEKLALQNYVKQGGAIMGIHAAADAEYNWPWYGEMLGGWFDGHPEIQTADCKVIDVNHPIVAGLPATWPREDEWYNFKKLSPQNQVLIRVDESTYTGGTHGENHPIAWCRFYDGGRVFYTGMGHTLATYKDPLFVKHIGRALHWLTY